MKIREFIERTSKEDFNLDILLEIKKYIPIMEKKKFAMDIIAACTDDVDGFIAADRFKMNIYFNMMVLGLYTNLEINSDFDEMVREYDLLCENGMLNNLLALFADDYSVMCGVLDGLLDELLVQNSIDMQVVRVANKIIGILDILGDNMDNINSLLPEDINIGEFLARLK